jgi:hypothetical protein
MKIVLSLVLVLALVPLSACAPKVNDPADIQAVTQTVEAYGKAVNSGDVAVATMTMTSTGTSMGKPFSIASRGTDFLVKRDGRWQAVSTQNTTIKP